MLIEFSELNIKLLVMLIYPLFNQVEHYAKELYLNNDNSYFNHFI